MSSKKKAGTQKKAPTPGMHSLPPKASGTDKPYRDIKPETPIASLDRAGASDTTGRYPLDVVAPVVGMSESFVKKVVGRKRELSRADVIALLDQDAFNETFIPRSKVLPYLERVVSLSPLVAHDVGEADRGARYRLCQGNALQLVNSISSASIQCIVTSTPYWAMRLYEDMQRVQWADGEYCAYGMEQTPEGFVRHSAEMILALSKVLTAVGSIWWNVMDTFNTRTQVRENAAEALRAMQGKETRGWKDYECRRYSAGHSFLKDGEQCLIPFSIAQRVSRMGLYVKSVISWAKTSSLPEPQESRVSRNVEYVLHISRQRTPFFAKEAFRNTAPKLGGRNPALEPNKLSDSWILPTSAGRDGHGAQFPLSLPGRCIAVSTEPNDYVFDPFCGAGTAGVAALALGRRFLGFDISETYLSVARRRLEAASEGLLIEDETLEPIAQDCAAPLLRFEGVRAVA
ncbi:DNA modification methylase [Paraburkholderia sp. Clong3]|uniref:DNA-methyltransferase n=1 Tax=Paraburkholderia sp. Clong3 TaxID=2991061 RepID=UPI003D240EA6